MVQVEASGFAVDRGVAVVAFFDDESWEIPIDISRARYVVSSPIIHSRMFTELCGIPHGMYVVLVFHDEDGDCWLDSGEETAISHGAGCPGDGYRFETLAVMNKSLLTSVVMEVEDDRTALCQPETEECRWAVPLYHSVQPVGMESSCSRFL
jgi:hypothetical protein